MCNKFHPINSALECVRSASCEGKTGVLGTLYLPEAFNELLSYSLFYKLPSSMLFLFDKATVWEILKWMWGLKWRAASLGEYECTVSVHSSILLNANVLVYLYEVLLMVLCCHWLMRYAWLRLCRSAWFKLSFFGGFRLHKVFVYPASP